MKIDPSAENCEAYARWLDASGSPGIAAILRALLSERREWLPIESAPKDGACRNVLVAYRNSHGKWRRMIAFWAPVDSLEADENSDTEYVAEGWYEYSDAAEAYYRCDEEPTHWQPLPAPPQSPGVEE